MTKRTDEEIVVSEKGKNEAVYVKSMLAAADPLDTQSYIGSLLDQMVTVRISGYEAATVYGLLLGFNDDAVLIEERGGRRKLVFRQAIATINLSV